MKKTQPDLNRDTTYFSAIHKGSIVIFKSKGNFLLNLSIIKAKESIMEYFEMMNAAYPGVRVVLNMSMPRKARQEEYFSFFDMVKSSRLTKSSVMRLYRTIDQIMLHIIASDLFFIDANCGQILPMTFNIALACDHRIIGDNSVFQNPALELGLVSKGGGAWFLNQKFGRARALQYLLRTKSLTAEEAIATGLADQCVPVHQLEDQAIARAEHFAALPGTSLRLAKRLVNRSMEGFSEYLEYENQLLLAAMHENDLLH